MRLTLLGTGDTRQVPVYGCHCPACHAARSDAAWRRGPCSALLECGDQRWLIDSGLTDLCERFPPGTLTGILQTHYHADHAQGLLQLRWGEGLRIPVFGPDDPARFADLEKHPGILDFSRPFSAFEQRAMGPLTVTALPLNHSRPTFGYLFLSNSDDTASHYLAYLTDTTGLPEETLVYLQQVRPNTIVLDCSEPPQPSPPRNHNDLNTALACIDRLNPACAVLTHIGHALDAWFLENPASLPERVIIARDGMMLSR